MFWNSLGAHSGWVIIFLDLLKHLHQLGAEDLGHLLTCREQWRIADGFLAPTLQKQQQQNQPKRGCIGCRWFIQCSKQEKQVLQQPWPRGNPALLLAQCQGAVGDAVRQIDGAIHVEMFSDKWNGLLGSLQRHTVSSGAVWQNFILLLPQLVQFGSLWMLQMLGVG